VDPNVLDETYYTYVGFTEWCEVIHNDLNDTERYNIFNFRDTPHGDNKKVESFKVKLI